VHNKLLEI